VKKVFETNHPAEPAWFCLRSQLEHEDMAAARLRQEGLEVFLPCVRFKRASVRGQVWETEALFPGYLFAHFNWAVSHRLVRHAPGISSIVSFGPHVPQVPAEVIAALRQAVGEQELCVISPEMSLGESVQIAGGALHGLSAVVIQVMPSENGCGCCLNS
jgi:transcriptional antiterminator RfaH